jgi:hypothetical protein
MEMVPEDATIPFSALTIEMLGLSYVNKLSAVPSCVYSTMFFRTAMPLPAGVRHFTIVLVDHAVVPHELEPRNDVAVAEYVPKFTPATVTDARPDVGVFSAKTSETPGASNEKTSMVVPTTVLIVVIAALGSPISAGDAHSTFVTVFHDEVAQSLEAKTIVGVTS